MAKTGGVKFKKLTLLPALVSLAFALSARADIGAYGFGSQTAALAGAGTAWGSGAYSAFSNPAALPDATGKKLRLSYGWLFMDPRFTPITNVITENEFTSDAERTGDVRDDYRSILGQAIGAAALLAPDWHQLSAGITIFTPFDPLGAIDTGEAYIPEYVLYRSRTQRPLIEAALAAKFGSQLSVGVGLHIGYAITANGTAMLQTEDDTISTMRVSASLKPKTSPNLSWLLVSQLPQNEPGAWTFGQVLRLPHDAKAKLVFNSSARAFGNLAALDLNFGASSALFYDPLMLETGFSWRHSPRGRLILQADFQNWTRFERPALEVDALEGSCENEDETSCSSLVNPTIFPALALRNLWIPRIAEEITWEKATLRLGYAYRPSMFSAVPNGAGNYLDPAKHSATIGWGWKFESFLGWNAPATLDLHGAYQHLVAQQITKTPGDEAGTAGKNKIGSPGYTAGGRLWGGGATLTLEL